MQYLPFCEWFISHSMFLSSSCKKWSHLSSQKKKRNWTPEVANCEVFNPNSCTSGTYTDTATLQLRSCVIVFLTHRSSFPNPRWPGVQGSQSILGDLFHLTLVFFLVPFLLIPFSLCFSIVTFSLLASQDLRRLLSLEWVFVQPPPTG